MTDLEMTKLCAGAMGIDVTGTPPPGLLEPLGSKVRLLHDQWTEYDPLHDDAQAMALVKNFGLNIHRFSHHRPDGDERIWQVVSDEGGAEGQDLNRAIVECVAKMQAGRNP